jgi:flagellar FliL protein
LRVVLAVVVTLAVVTLVAWLANGARATAGPEAAERHPLLVLPPALVNLDEPGGRRLLRTSLEFELADQARLRTVAADALLTTRLKDMVILTLSSKSFEDIRGAQGKVALRAELVARANAILGEGAVRSVYFAEFVVR